MSLNAKVANDQSLPTGNCDQNPKDIGLLALLREDFETYRRDPLAAGFGRWRCIGLATGAWA